MATVGKQKLPVTSNWMRPTDDLRPFSYPTAKRQKLMRLWSLAFIAVVLGIVLLKPFQGMGDRMIGPIGGDLLNGAVPLAIMIVVGIMSVIALRRRKVGTK